MKKPFLTFHCKHTVNVIDKCVNIAHLSVSIAFTFSLRFVYWLSCVAAATYVFLFETIVLLIVYGHGGMQFNIVVRTKIII